MEKIINRKTRLLFICTSNLDRSPLAEEICMRTGKYEVKSAGFQPAIGKQKIKTVSLYRRLLIGIKTPSFPYSCIIMVIDPILSIALVADPVYPPEIAGHHPMKGSINTFLVIPEYDRSCRTNIFLFSKQ